MGHQEKQHGLEKNLPVVEKRARESVVLGARRVSPAAKWLNKVTTRVKKKKREITFDPEDEDISGLGETSFRW